MRRVLLSAALLAGTLAAPAFAQAGAPFTGLRAEGLVGWDRSQAGGSHDDGAMYGAAVGYDFQFGRALVGVEGEISDASTRQCDGPENDRLCARAGRDLYVGGRIGQVIGTRTLVYAKAGYSNGRYGISYDDGVSRVSDSRDLDGLRVGAGAEYAIGPNSFVKAEYRYSNYQADISRHQLAAGFGFRF